MNALPLLTGLEPSAAWTPDQARRARTRMLKPWHRYLAQCHGVWAVQLAAPEKLEPDLPIHALRMACVWHFGQSFRASRCQWPLQPSSLDLVIWRLSADDMEHLPALIAQINVSLKLSARVLVWVEAPLLNTWCQIGMPLCFGHDWHLRQADWGDARALTWLPSRWSPRWSALLQIWLPRSAQWSVQLWQRESLSPISRAPKQAVRKRLAAGLRWQPQPTINHLK